MSTDSTPSIRHRLEYSAVRLLLRSFSWIPGSAAPGFSRVFGTIAHGLLRGKAHLARDAMRRFFGDEKSEREIDRLVRRVFVNLSRTILELADLSFSPIESIRRRIDLSEIEPMIQRVCGGRSVIVAGSHQGNWELSGLAMAERMPIASFARPLDNPLLDRLVNDLRSRTGQRIVSKRGGLREMLRYLKEGALAVILIDQDAGRHGVWAPFLGRPAATIDTPFRLAWRLRIPVVALGTERIEGTARHRLHMTEPIEVERTGDTERDIRVAVARANRELGEFVRRWPDQYFGWLHRRWKTTVPPGEPVYDAGGDRIDCVGEAVRDQVSDEDALSANLTPHS